VSAPFRELFVELPTAVFETLRAIGEGAVEKARTGDYAYMFKTHYVPRPAPARRASLFESRHTRLIAHRYGWIDAELRKMIDRDSLQLGVILNCGHLQRYEVNELSILRCSSAADEVALLDSVVDGTLRGCSCVQRPPRDA
jgi:hypothetical protein